METTVDLEKIKSGSPFVWGEVVKIHEISEYAIIEYHPFVCRNHIGTGEISQDTEYHIYISGENQSVSTRTLDEALVTCVARKYDGINSHAPYYFMKMIKQEAK